MTSFSFLKSSRFWQMFVVAFLLALQQYGYISSDVYNALATLLELWLGSSVVMRTIDRFGEKAGGQ